MSDDNIPLREMRPLPGEAPEEFQARFMERLNQDPWHDQDENGIDLSLIRENLKLTPTERMIKAQNAANALIQFRDALNRA